MSKAVPEGWTIQTLDGKVHILSGFPFKSSLFTDDPDFMGIIRIRDLEKQSIETFYAGDFDETYVVRRGDVLIGMDGDFNIVKWNAKNALLNQRVCKVKAEADSSFDTDFLFQSLKDDLLSINAATGATTVKHLSVKDIRGIEKAFPPLPEQQKIATILSSVDDVIGKTRAQIDKLKDLKTGMMLELLTKGIGHTEFKDSPVGRIPKSWQCLGLRDVATVVDSLHKTPAFSEHGEPMVRATEIRKTEHLDISDAVKVDRSTFVEFSRNYTPRIGDILIARVGAYFGVTSFVASNMSFCLGQNTASIRAVSIEPSFLYNFLQSECARKQMDDSVATGAQPSLSLKAINELKIPIPNLVEQRSVAKYLNSIKYRISMLDNKLLRLKYLKKALMQDLLTGKVRVKLTDKESAVV